MKKKLLIVGGRSFIGNALFFAAMKKGWDVDVWGREETKEMNLNGKEYNFIVNMAAAGSKSGTYSEKEMFETNVILPQQLLELTTDMKYQAFVHVSTSSVYGKVDRAMREDMPLNPTFPYAYTKAAADVFVNGYAQYHQDKPVSIVRPFSVYGNMMQDSKLIPVVVRRILRGEEITLVDGVHDFIHVNDVVSGIFFVLKNTKSLPVVNIGNGYQITNREVVEMCEEYLGKKAILASQDGLEGHSHYKLDSDVWVANCDRLRRLGWRPQVDFRKWLAAYCISQRFQMGL